MKKRVYRSTNVKKINIKKLQEKVEGKELVLGVDVAKEKFMAVIMTPDQAVIATISWKHPVESQEFFDLILKELKWYSLEVALEPTGTYGDFLRAYFLDQGIGVYGVNPKRSHDAAEVYDGVPSMHDAKAAAIICRLHLDGASGEWPMQEDNQRELKAALKIMQMYDSAYFRLINQLEGLTARHWPELTQYMKLTSASLQELLKEYGCPQHVAQCPESARALLKKVGGHSLKNVKVDGVIASAKTTFGINCLVSESEQISVLSQEIVRLRKKRIEAKRRIETLTKQIEVVDNMAPVVGRVTGAILYTILGDMDTYKNTRTVIKTLGLNLKERSSGNYKGMLQITKRGSSVARRYLYMAVLRLIQKDLVIKAWYNKKLARDGDGRVKKKALIAIMRKLVSALWHVGKGAKFDSSKLFDVKRLAI